jgi:hypothetical protein
MYHNFISIFHMVYALKDLLARRVVRVQVVGTERKQKGKGSPKEACPGSVLAETITAYLPKKECPNL